MDFFLNKVTQHAVSYAIRSGITITGGFAIKQCTRYLHSTPKSGLKSDLIDLQGRLESKIRIISPAIDMIELIAARGNTSLESAVSLTKELRWQIQALGVRLANAANKEELRRRGSSKARSREQTDLELQLIVSDVRRLLARIEDAVPLINLAITTSGVSLSTNLPATVSPSRLLQASTFLTASDSQYATGSMKRVQVGPAYTLSMYMLFTGHTWRSQDDEDIRETTWKEVIHKARVKLVRVPLDDLYALPGDHVSGEKSNLDESIRGDGAALEFAYHIVFVEDFDDDRVHNFDDEEAQPSPFDDVGLAGIRDLIPIHEISKIFYADTGKILNIGSEGETNNPVLLLKRDIHSEPPRRMMEKKQTESFEYEDENASEDRPGGGHCTNNGHLDEEAELEAQFRRESSAPLPPESPAAQSDRHSTWRLPQDLDPEWIAFEVYNEEPDSDDEAAMDPSDIDRPSSNHAPSSHHSSQPDVTGQMANLRLTSPSSEEPASHAEEQERPRMLSGPTPPVKTSLSLLEMLIRLTALQQFRQSSHLTIEDELLNFFLEDSSTTGAGPNAEYRQRVRRDARRRVGFDPYDESPIKRRGEEYLAHPRATPMPGQDWDYDSRYDNSGTRQESVRPSVEFASYRNRTPEVPSTPSPLPRASPNPMRTSPLTDASARPRSDSPGYKLSSLRSRQQLLRSQSERPASPLTRNSAVQATDSRLGTSPDVGKVPDMELEQT